MEAEWIKIRVEITSEPRVLAMAHYLNSRPAFVEWIGVPAELLVTRNVTRNVTLRVTVTSLVKVWGNANRCGKVDGEDLVVPFATLDTVDEWADHPEFASAMQMVGWLRQEVDGKGATLVRFPKFLQYNTPANERAKTKNAERQRRFRDKHRDTGVTRDVTGNAHCNAERNVTRNVTVTHREEEIREEKNIEEKNPLSPTPGTPAKQRSGHSSPNYTPEFQQFWAAYPNPKNKADAFRAWQKIRPDAALVQTILQAVERGKSSRDWLEQNGKFIPYPASWLNGRRWEDGTPVPLTNPSPAVDPAVLAKYEADLAAQREADAAYLQAKEANKRFIAANGGSLFARNASRSQTTQTPGKPLGEPLEATCDDF